MEDPFEFLNSLTTIDSWKKLENTHINQQLLLIKSSTGTSQPSTGTSQPSTGMSQPSTGTSQPSTGASQPSTGASQPSTSVMSCLSSAMQDISLIQPDVQSNANSSESSQKCPQCNYSMIKTINELEYICENCGLVREVEDTIDETDVIDKFVNTSSRLRVVGPNSSHFQPDLYRSCAVSTAALQKKQILEEYQSYRQQYINAGHRSFPVVVCVDATQYYNKIQQSCVKRSKNKKVIMAACLLYACLKHGISAKKEEIAAFMQLPNNGLAKGDNFIRGLTADGKFDIDVDVDEVGPEISTLFAYLGYNDERYDSLKNAVREIIQISLDNNIGTTSVLKSKVAGATFTILSRSSLITEKISLQTFCKDRIRKNTIDKFIKQLTKFHSYFEQCYKKYELDHKASED